MKYVLVPFERFRQGSAVFTDGEGCVYLKPATHPAIAGKEFANELEFRQLVMDHMRDNPKDKIGEVILLPVYTV